MLIGKDRCQPIFKMSKKSWILLRFLACNKLVDMAKAIDEPMYLLTVLVTTSYPVPLSML